MARKKDELSKSERIFVRIALLQTLLAVIGIVTGSIALYAALTEADASRKQQEAAVWPMLQMAITDYDTENQEAIFNISARNAGIGPARIAAFRVTVDGVAQSDWDETFMTLAGSSENVLRSYFIGRVISADEEVDLVLARGEVARAALKKIYDGEARLEWDVCYCSVFDKCWMSSNKGSTWLKPATPVEQCPDYGDEQFRG